MKNIILKATDELFTSYGLRLVTMDDISKKVGISKKTLYQYFDDKDELVNIIVKQKLDEQWAAMEEISHQTPNPIEEVLKMSEYIKKAMSMLHPAVVYEMKKFFPNAYLLYQNHIDECFKSSFTKNLEKGIQLGLYRNNINVDILANMRIIQIESGFNPELFPPNQFKLEDIQVEFIIHFLYGICTIKGFKMINKYYQLNEE